MERGLPHPISRHDSHLIVRLALLGVISTCAAIVAATWLAYLFSRERCELDLRTCKLVPAIVLGKGQSIRERAGVSLPACHVRYAISFGGRRLEGLATVSREHYAWIRTGESTPAYVDTSNPGRHFLKLERDARIGRRSKPAYVAAAVGLAAICLHLLSERRRLRLPGNYA